MRSKVKHVITAIIIFALIMCWGISIGYTNNIKPQRDVTNFFFEESEITASDLKNIKEIKKDLTVVGWREDSSQTIINKDLNRTVNKLKVLSVKGDTSLLLRNVTLLEDDKIGCLIDEDTAYKLFGSKYALGRCITYDDRELIIRGIHNETKANVIVQLLDDSDVKLNGICIDSSKISYTDMNDFMLQSGIMELPISGSIYYTIAKILIFILPITIALILTFKMFIKIIKVRKKPILCTIYILLLCVIIIILFKTIKVKINIPLDMIPNKWSDFEFWGNLWKESMDKLQYVVYMKKYGFDIYNIENLAKVVVYSISTMVLFIASIKLLKIGSVKQLIIVLGFSIISSFVIVLIGNFKYGFDINIKMLWVVYPLYLTFNELIKKLDCLVVESQQ